MTDSIPCVGEDFPQTQSKPVSERNRLNREERLREAARLERLAQYLVPAVCEEFGVTSAALMSKRQDRMVSRPRKYAWWVLRHHPDGMFSYPVIGAYFNRDHTTVMHGVNTAAHEVKSGFNRVPFHVQRVCNRLSFHGFRDWVVRHGVE